MAFSIRMNEEEKALAESYAKLHAMSLGEAFKRALFERIEEEYDISLANEAYQEYKNNGCKSRPIEELWKELNLRATMWKPRLDSIKSSKNWTNTHNR